MIKALTLNKKVWIAAIVAFVLMAATVVYANPLYLASVASSATATTTVTYMTPGTATSTVVYDSYETGGTNQKNQGNQTIPNAVSIVVQGVSSSSVSVLNLACEYSYDGIDWYQNDVFSATSSGVMNISAPSTFSYTFASTTLNGVAFGNKYAKVVQCPLPLRYVRAVITNTGANLSVWSAIIPTKQRI